ncbi:hypothetical protein O9G_003369 [Rozella allomycis CSF55]|uniref:Uncharacterized protein n=1 Tax=Rozella allomycis (strain CSF55) TaxID=988480 RepID=A0A075AZK2_ROZAC|nr:hypothetical protein O9G_003369 [Rozella allomycis CSF55]|eukprot:EPZ35751.1 hypothetical protein O9G_003369 [Rozella allomycis CSF55]
MVSTHEKLNIWIAANVTMVKHYIENEGFSPNAKDDNGYFPLAAAVAYDHLDVIEYLLQRNADINLTDNEGGNCLFYCENIEIAQMLISRGANHLLKDHAGLSVLDFAIENDYEDDIINLWRGLFGIPLLNDVNDGDNQAFDE